MPCSVIEPFTFAFSFLVLNTEPRVLGMHSVKVTHQPHLFLVAFVCVGGHVWRSEDNFWEPVFSFYNVGLGD